MEASSAERVLEQQALRLVHIEPQHLPHMWPLVEPLLQKAVARSNGEFTVNDVLANLDHWPILALVQDTDMRAVMVVSISQRGDGQRTLNCILASGEDARSWPLVDDQLDELARGWGCSRVRIPVARKGWAKTLPHWKLTGYVMERDC